MRSIIKVIVLIPFFLFPYPVMADSVIGSAEIKAIVLPAKKSGKTIHKKKIKKTEASLKKRRKIVSIRILQVRNERGNNPLNQKQPVNNLNGTTYSSLSETLDVLLNRGATTQVGTSSTQCTGTYTMKHSGGAPADHRFASIEVDPNTGKCKKVHEDGSSGSFLIVQTPPDADPSDGVAFPDVLVGLWTIINPPPNDASGNGVRLTNNTPITITVQSTSGVRVQVTIQIIPQGGNEYKLQVIQIKKL